MKDPGKLLVGRLHGRLLEMVACVVDQDMERPEPLLHFLDERRDRRQVRDVMRKVLRAAFELHACIL